MLGSKFYLSKVNLYANASKYEMKLDSRMGKHLCRRNFQSPKCYVRFMAEDFKIKLLEIL